MTPLDITVADLIARLDWELGRASDLDRVSEAHLRARTLADLGEQLISHYVDHAKRAGASWTEIGEALGVSKQAAQQRHAPSAFDGFTDSSRHSIVLAQEAARSHRHGSIGTEHLLLGLLGETAGLAHEVLVAKAGSEQRVREAIEAATDAPGKKATRGHIPFATSSKEALARARQASLDLGHDWIGTEHTLLGLSRGSETPAAAILRGLGFTPDELRRTVEATAVPPGAPAR